MPYLPDLAMSLLNLGLVALKFQGVTTDVVGLTTEGVVYLQALASAEPDAFTGRYQEAATTLAQLHETLADNEPTT